jgi:hypothetical protein
MIASRQEAEIGGSHTVWTSDGGVETHMPPLAKST